MSFYDNECLDEEEIEFCKFVDALQLRSYRILRLVENLPEQYNLKAKALFQTIEEEVNHPELIGRRNNPNISYSKFSTPSKTLDNSHVASPKQFQV